MAQLDPNSTRRKRPWATLSIAAVAGAFAATIALPATSSADPEPAPPAPATTTAPPPAPATTTAPPAASPSPQPGDPNATPPPPVDPNAPPPPPVDPNAPPPPVADPNAGRIGNAVGGFSYVLPAGWVQSDASHLDYGSELLSKTTGQPPLPGQAPPVANDTRIVMGRLDQKLYASAEPDNAKAALRLGSDMGEFFMPYPGTRINQEATPLTGANGITGSASFYEVKFTDASKPNGQIWTGVVGTPANASTGTPPQRWFVVWLGTGNDPVDKGAAKALAESIQPWSGQPAPAAPPAPGAPGAPAPAPGAPAPAPAPVPGQAPAGEVTPTPSPAPQRTVPA